MTAIFSALPDFAHLSEMEAYFGMKNIMENWTISRHLLDCISAYGVRWQRELLMRHDRVNMMLHLTAQWAFLILRAEERHTCSRVIFQLRQAVVNFWAEDIRALTNMDLDITPRRRSSYSTLH